MKTRALCKGLLGLVISVASTAALSDSHRPTCDEKPEVRDCVKVEDPDAQAPAASVHRKPKPPGPTARPLPAAGGPKTQ